MAEVEIKLLNKVYSGNTRAVTDVNAHIRDGEFIVLVGPSGCGKSTILRMIAGLESISTGELFIDGRKVNGVEPGKRDIAMVFQNYALYPHMSVRRNMEYGLKNEGLPRDQIATRIAEAARTLQLEDYLDRKPRNLSGGQRQRVAMGRAIVRDPKVFLFDEPLSNLDAKLRTQLRSELKALHRRLAATFVYVTHDQVEAMSLADRIIIMNAGRVEQIGTPLDVYERPATRFVADFIGNPSMNLMTGIVAEDRARVVLTSGPTIALSTEVEAAPGTSVDLGIRPEHLRVSDTGGADLTLSVHMVEHLGADTIVHGHIGQDAGALSLRVDGVQDFREHTQVPLAIAPGHLHLFDTQTGQRLNCA
ncbi:ABC transporter ATP-binding protein [Thalassovita taeanensis]|uniref:Carbohydrate ABC transporter ATP-binding protein, CUT1 family (TC 3.A.1.1.-) n=1 Tax=Thalassovita taeanensis TaxID=657014 RepID=A0A1H9J792_9RHOB|nr:sn-glycerol-3-phosphate ABC transporter ATP-binding protein UgpC [Thalassovita taeanensis]SEQ82673.1 carbohydrate ABC transporter ATP-binding protein, CUT1 family (TC 3.A.1.1.-) [Thalassovita taeanensis]